MSRTALLLLIVCCVALLCIHIAYHRFRHSITIINCSCIRRTHPQLTQLNHFSTSLLQGGIVCNCNSLLFSYIKHSSFSTAPSKSEVLCERIPSLEGQGWVHLLKRIIDAMSSCVSKPKQQWLITPIC